MGGFADSAKLRLFVEWRYPSAVGAGTATYITAVFMPLGIVSQIWRPDDDGG